MQDAPDRSAPFVAASQGGDVPQLGNKDTDQFSSMSALEWDSKPTHDNSGGSESPYDCSPQEDDARISKTASTADSDLYYGSKRAEQKRNAAFASRGRKSLKPEADLENSNSSRSDPGMSSGGGSTASMSGAEVVANDVIHTATAGSSGGYVGQKREVKGSIHIDGKKRYPCPFAGCDKTFSTSGHSSRHSRIHTGEKPYHCTYPGCRAQFSRYDNSLQHYRTHIISSKDGKKPRGKAASTASLENGESSQGNKAGRKSRSSLKASEQQPSSDQKPDGLANSHSVPGRTSDGVSNQSDSQSKSSESFSQSGRKPLLSYSSEPPSRQGNEPIIEKERNLSLPLVPLEKLRESQHGLSSHLRSQDGVKRMRLSSRPPPLHSSICDVQDDPQFVVPNSYDFYEKRSASLSGRPSMKRETYTWHGMGSGVSVMDHLRPGVGLTLPSRGPAKSKPALSAYSPYPSPTRAAFEKPMLACSQTFDLGSRPIPYPLAGTELDRRCPAAQPESSNSSKLSLGSSSSFPPSVSMPEGAWSSNFSMRRSGSMPSLLSLDEPRLESSNSLLKYSLSSGKSTPKLNTLRKFSDQAEHMSNRAVGSGAHFLATELDSETNVTMHQGELLPSLSATRR